MLIRTSLSAFHLEALIYEVSERVYASNLNIETLTLVSSAARSDRSTYRVKLGTHDSYAIGSRTSASGRHGRWCSWHAFRDVMAAIFRADPQARIATGMMTYRNARDFLDKFEETGDQNVGSLFAPASLRDLSVDGFEGDDSYVRELRFNTNHLMRVVTH